jgi:hypothetical protein
MDREQLPAPNEIVSCLAVWSMIPRRKACPQETSYRLQEVDHGYDTADAD